MIILKLKIDPNKDRLHKIRPLFEALRQSCLSQRTEENNSIVEQIMWFNGKSFLKRDLPNKPHKWGFNIFSRNGVFGMFYNFEFNGAPKPKCPETVDEIGYYGADVVLRLCHYLSKQSGY